MAKKIKKSTVTREMANASKNRKFDKIIEHIITSSIDDENLEKGGGGDDDSENSYLSKPGFSSSDFPIFHYSNYNDSSLDAIEEQDDIKVLEEIYKKNPLLNDTDPSKSQPLSVIKQQMLLLLSDRDWLKSLADRYCMTTLDLMKVLYNHYEFMQNKFYLNKLSRSLKQTNSQSIHARSVKARKRNISAKL